MDFPPSQLWPFSLAFYRRPGVADACLALQDRHGIDVNLLLAALWAAQSGIALGVADWARLGGAVAAFHREVVCPLRAARRALKPVAESGPPVAAQLRHAVKAAELDAEHLEQIMIEAALPTGSGGASAAAARANLLAYLAHCGVEPDPADAAAIARLLAAAIPPAG